MNVGGQDNLQGQSSPCTLLRQLLGVLLSPLPIRLECTGITDTCATVSGFPMASGDSNSGHRACVARALPTEASLQPSAPPLFETELHRVAQLS